MCFVASYAYSYQRLRGYAPNESECDYAGIPYKMVPTHDRPFDERRQAGEI